MLALTCRRSRPSRALLLRRGLASAVTFTSSGPDASRSLVGLLEAHSAEQSALASASSGSSSPDEPSVTVFALSHDVPNLASVLRAVQRLHPHAIGCLSSPPADGTSSLALAHFFDDATERFGLFRSKEVGRASTSVGHCRPLHELAAEGDSVAGSEGGSGVDEDRLRKAFEGGNWSGMWGDEAMAKAEGVPTATLEGIETAEFVGPAALPCWRQGGPC